MAAIATQQTATAARTPPTSSQLVFFGATNFPEPVPEVPCGAKVVAAILGNGEPQFEQTVLLLGQSMGAQRGSVPGLALQTPRAEHA